MNHKNPAYVQLHEYHLGAGRTVKTDNWQTLELGNGLESIPAGVQIEIDSGGQKIIGG